MSTLKASPLFTTTKKKNFKVKICYHKLQDDNITSYTLKKAKHRGAILGDFTISLWKEISKYHSSLPNSFSFLTTFCILSSCLSFALVVTCGHLNSSFFFLCWTNSTFIVVTWILRKKGKRNATCICKVYCVHISILSWFYFFCNKMKVLHI